MEVDTTAKQATSQSSGPSVVIHPVTQAVSQLVRAHALTRRLSSVPQTNRVSVTLLQVFWNVTT